MTDQWKTRAGYETALKPSAPGIYRLKSGGYLVRVRVISPRTGKEVDTSRAMPEAKLQDAQREQRTMREAILAEPKNSLPSWAAYALLVFERKVKAGSLLSAKTRERWSSEIAALATVKFEDESVLGLLPVDAVSAARVEQLRNILAETIEGTKGLPTRKGKLSLQTANSRLRTFRQICRRMIKEHKLGEDPTELIDYFFSLRAHRTYTRENPNSLTPALAMKFLATIHEEWPQHFAFILLGIVTGLRPSSIRPLRRRGPNADINWEMGTLTIRRSHTLGGEADVMDATKTAVDQEITLPPQLLVVLRQQVDLIENPPRNAKGKPPLWWRAPMATSDLLFPGRDGSYRARAALDKVFDQARKAAGISFRLTPRAMRRTFKDLARQAGVSDVASMAVSGHQTEDMHVHYQTVSSDEMRAEIGKVVALLEPGALTPNGVKSGVSAGLASSSAM